MKLLDVSIICLITLLFMKITLNAPITTSVPDCSNYSSCEDCTGENACGWCQTGEEVVDGECTSGNGNGPFVEDDCPSGLWKYDYCELDFCAFFDNCDKCLSVQNLNCGWCDTRCLNGSAAGPTFELPCENWLFPPNTCESTYNCTNYDTCSVCNKQSNCGWCINITEGYVIGDESICLDLSENCTNWSAHCVKEEDRCKRLKDCQSCLETPSENCGWCASSETCIDRFRPNFCPEFLQDTCDEFCFEFGDCTKCTNKTSCGWCGNTVQSFCTLGNSTSPSHFNSSVCDLGWLYNNCSINCSMYNNCTECAANIQCEWCFNEYDNSFVCNNITSHSSLNCTSVCTPSSSPSSSPSPSPSSSPPHSPFKSRSPTASSSPSATISPLPSNSSSPSPTPSHSPLKSRSPSESPSVTTSVTSSPSPSHVHLTITRSESPTPTSSSSPSDSSSSSPARSPFKSRTPTNSMSLTPSESLSPSSSISTSATSSESLSISQSPSTSLSHSSLPSRSSTSSISVSPSQSLSPSTSNSISSTPPHSISPSLSLSQSVSLTSSNSKTMTVTKSQTPSQTPPISITPSSSNANSHLVGEIFAIAFAGVALVFVLVLVGVGSVLFYRFYWIKRWYYLKLK